MLLQCMCCNGNDENRYTGFLSRKSQGPEKMVGCASCKTAHCKCPVERCHTTLFLTARLDHPSCLKLSNIADVIRGYDWRCQFCKRCEACGQRVCINILVYKRLETHDTHAARQLLLQRLRSGMAHELPRVIILGPGSPGY